MPPTPSRLRRVLLRAIVLLQLSVIGLVAFTAVELVTFGCEVTPAAIALVACMLASTTVALRVSFLRGAGTRGHRLAFMAAQVVVALAPLLAHASLGFLAAGSPLPPAEVLGVHFVILLMALEVLVAAVLAAVSALLCPVLLPAASESAATPALGPIVGRWAGAAAIAVALVTVLYGRYFAEEQILKAKVDRILTGKEDELRLNAARQLAATDLSRQPAIRLALFDGLEAPTSSANAWAAYVLIASGTDDGRAMTTLRKMMRTLAVAPAARSLSLLGTAAAPALRELSDLVAQPTGDFIAAGAQEDAAEALGAIGPPAVGAVPVLLARAVEAKYQGLRVAAGQAIDRIDPGFAKRCTQGAATMVDALTAGQGPLAIRLDCLPPAARQPETSAALSAKH